MAALKGPRKTDQEVKYILVLLNGGLHKHSRGIWDTWEIRPGAFI